MHAPRGPKTRSRYPLLINWTIGITKYCKKLMLGHNLVSSTSLYKKETK